jgi:hypothetical protein
VSKTIPWSDPETQYLEGLADDLPFQVLVRSYQSKASHMGWPKRTERAIRERIYRIVSRQPRQIAGELVEDVPSEGPSFAEERSGAQGLEDLIRIGHRRGMANPRGWAMNVLKARQVKMRRRRFVA